MYQRICHALRKRMVLLVFLAALFSVLLAGSLKKQAALSRLTYLTPASDSFRDQHLGSAATDELQKLAPHARGCAAALYLLCQKDNPDTSSFFQKENLVYERSRWSRSPFWEPYLLICRTLWNDTICFPVPDCTSHPRCTTSYADSWMSERTFGGQRGHEGCDIIASVDKPGLYPVLSMTDGVVEHMGWLPKGGWRIGIRAPSGGYFYYAHLDSYAALDEGDPVHAGDILGFMGNTGYGPEGTKDQFATHLHVGIYFDFEGREISVNPYWILKVIEEKKLSCSF